jgi:hypothetical protein
VARRAEPYPRDALADRQSVRPAAGTLLRRARRRARLRKAPPRTLSRKGPHTLVVLHAAETTGPSRSLDARLRWLASIGSLAVVVPGPGAAADNLAGLALVTRLEYAPLMLPGGLLGLPLALSRLRREMREFGAVVDRERPDLVIVVSTLLPAALIAARRRRVPTVLHAAEVHRGREVKSYTRRVLGGQLIRLEQRLATGVVATSESVALQFREGGRGRAPVTTIPPPIADVYGGGDGDAFRSRHTMDADAPCVMAIGNVTRARGQDILLRAMPAIRRAVPGAHCAIVGFAFARPKDEAFERFLRELQARLGLAGAVTFTGVETRIADAYAAAGVVVNAARAPEGGGRVALEALAAGRPVVATDVGSAREVLGEYDAVSLVTPEDENALATAVIEVLQRGERARQAARECGREVLDRFDPERDLEAFKRVIERSLPSASHS